MIGQSKGGLFPSIVLKLHSGILKLGPVASSFPGPFHWKAMARQAEQMELERPEDGTHIPPQANLLPPPGNNVSTSTTCLKLYSLRRNEWELQSLVERVRSELGLRWENTFCIQTPFGFP